MTFFLFLLAHTTSTLVISSALGELTMPVLVGQVYIKFTCIISNHIISLFERIILSDYNYLLILFKKDTGRKNDTILCPLIQHNKFTLQCEHAGS